MIVRWISLDPPGIVHSHELMKSSTQAPDSQPLEIGFCSTVWPAEADDLGAEVGHPLQQLAVEQLHDRGVGGADRRPSSWRSTSVAAQRPQRRHLGLERRQPVLHDRVVDRPPPIGTGPGARLDQPAEPGVAEPLGQLEHRHAPLGARASPGRPASRRSRRPTRLAAGIDHVVEEHLAEVRLAGGLADGADVDARRAHVEQEVGDALALRGRRRRCGRAAGTSRRAARRWPTPSGRSRRSASPSRRAVVRRLARSEPASGSEKPWHQISPSRMAGRWRRRCSSVPAASSVDAAWWIDTNASTRRGASWAASSWYSTICSAVDMPAAPLRRPVRHRVARAAQLLEPAFWKATNSSSETPVCAARQSGRDVGLAPLAHRRRGTRRGRRGRRAAHAVGSARAARAAGARCSSDCMVTASAAKPACTAPLEGLATGAC